MKKKDVVFQLVKSLSKGEKRNFSMLSQMTGKDKKYLRLFELMDKQEEYDEDRILRALEDDPALQRQISYYKNYLFHAILNSLAYFEKSEGSDLFQMIRQIQILHGKNLFSAAGKLIRKAKNLARECEQFEELTMLVGLELSMIQRSRDLRLLADDIREIEFEEKMALEKLSNLKAYQKLNRKVGFLDRKRAILRSSSELDQIKQVRKDPLLEGAERAKSVRAKLIYFDVQRRLAKALGDHAGALDHVMQALNILDSNPRLREIYHEDYISLLSSSIAHHSLTGGREKAFEMLDKLKAIKPNNEYEASALFERYGMFWFGIQLDSGLVAGSEDRVLEFEEALDKEIHPLADHQKMWLWYLLAQYHFMNGEMRKAQHWTNRFLNMPRNGFRLDVQCLVRLLQLLAHLELRNSDLLEYHLKSASRFFVAEDRMYKYEKVMLKYIRAATRKSDWRRDHAFLDSWNAELLPLKEDEFEGAVWALFDANLWLESVKAELSMFEQKGMPEQSPGIRKA